VGGQRHAPAALPGERDKVPILQEAGCARGTVLRDGGGVEYHAGEETSLYTCQESNSIQFVARYEVLTVVTVKITVFCDVTPCSLVEIHDDSKGRTVSISFVGETPVPKRRQA